MNFSRRNLLCTAAFLAVASCEKQNPPEKLGIFHSKNGRYSINLNCIDVEKTNLPSLENLMKGASGKKLWIHLKPNPDDREDIFYRAYDTGAKKINPYTQENVPVYNGAQLRIGWRRATGSLEEELKKTENTLPPGNWQETSRPKFTKIGGYEALIANFAKGEILREDLRDCLTLVIINKNSEIYFAVFIYPGTQNDPENTPQKLITMKFER
jgi:hypothetical protein